MIVVVCHMLYRLFSGFHSITAVFLLFFMFITKFYTLNNMIFCFFLAVVVCHILYKVLSYFFWLNPLILLIIIILQVLRTVFLCFILISFYILQTIQHVLLLLTLYKAFLSSYQQSHLSLEVSEKQFPFKRS